MHRQEAFVFRILRLLLIHNAALLPDEDWELIDVDYKKPIISEKREDGSWFTIPYQSINSCSDAL
jgi:hypothetical protein